MSDTPISLSYPRSPKPHMPTVTTIPIPNFKPRNWKSKRRRRQWQQGRNETKQNGMAGKLTTQWRKFAFSQRIHNHVESYGTPTFFHSLFVPIYTFCPHRYKYRYSCMLAKAQFILFDLQSGTLHVAAAFHSSATE